MKSSRPPKHAISRRSFLKRSSFMVPVAVLGLGLVAQANEKICGTGATSAQCYENPSGGGSSMWCNDGKTKVRRNCGACKAGDGSGCPVAE